MGPTFATASIKACQNRIPMHDKTLLNPSEVRRMDMAWGSFCGQGDETFDACLSRQPELRVVFASQEDLRQSKNRVQLHTNDCSISRDETLAAFELHAAQVRIVPDV